MRQIRRRAVTGEPQALRPVAPELDTVEAGVGYRNCHANGVIEELRTSTVLVDARRIESLQQMAIFGGVRYDVLELILSLAPVVQAREGAFFFMEDDTPGSMYVLEEGSAVALKSISGTQHRVREFKPGDCFGEMSMMDYSPRSASVQAIRNCAALAISTGCLQRIYEQDLEQFTIIEMNMGREVTRRLRDAMG